MPVSIRLILLTETPSIFATSAQLSSRSSRSLRSSLATVRDRTDVWGLPGMTSMFPRVHLASNHSMEVFHALLATRDGRANLVEWKENHSGQYSARRTGPPAARRRDRPEDPAGAAVRGPRPGDDDAAAARGDDHRRRRPVHRHLAAPVRAGGHADGRDQRLAALRRRGLPAQERSRVSEIVSAARHDGAVLLDDVVQTSATVSATRSRRAKREALARMLRRAGDEGGRGGGCL